MFLTASTFAEHHLPSIGKKYVELTIVNREVLGAAAADRASPVVYS